MLHKLTLSNFQSFREPTTIDWVQNAKVAETSWFTTAATGERVAKVMGVIGANASGKTALLKPLVFLSWYMRESFMSLHPEAPIPVAPHIISESDEPACFELEYDFQGYLWRYELSCTQTRVVHEALYKKAERFGYVFIREWEPKKKNYSFKQQGFGFSTRKATEACNSRPNASFISIAAQHGVPLAVSMSVFIVTSNINALGKVPMSDTALFDAAKQYTKDAKQREWMQSLLVSWDLGLSNVSINEINLNAPDGSKSRTEFLPYGEHMTRAGKKILPFFDESNGTQSAFVLLSKLLPALFYGGIAVIDEFESDLHPHILEPILDLFANPTMNPLKAQLLFTCHAIEILNLLPKSQIMLVEKNEMCESEAWRLDTVDKIRSDDNFYAKYMAGAYGAVPRI